jgi:hypothetical protein
MRLNRPFNEQTPPGLAKRWERQLDHDASSGKLDFLLDEAHSERDAGSLKVWPPES